MINLASLTDWGVDVSGSLKNLGVRSQAFMNDNYLAASQVHQKYTGLHAVRDHLISGAVLSTVPQYEYGYFGQAMDLSPCGMVGHPAGHKQSRSAWANYIGRKSHYSSSFNNTDWDFSTSGVQVGTDIFRSCRNQFGIFFGYEGSNGWNAADKIDAKDYYVGLYGVHVFNNGMDLRAVFNYGWQDFNSRRYDLLQNTHRMAFDGNSAELNLELGKRRYFGNWSARPLIALDWNYSRLSRGQEDGIVSEAINYKSTDLSQLFFRFGTDLRYELGRWAVEGGVYYSYDLLGDDLQTGVSLADGSLPSSLVGSELGRSVLTYNIGGSLNVYRNLSIFGGYRGEVTPESIGNGVAHTGYVGAALRW